MNARIKTLMALHPWRLAIAVGLLTWCACVVAFVLLAALRQRNVFSGDLLRTVLYTLPAGVLASLLVRVASSLDRFHAP
jgi:hypothetical protein